MLVEWVIGRAIGDRAKSILDHAHAGMGYQILEQGKQGNQAFCLYAFRRAMDSPVPDHLTRVVDPFMLKKLNDREDQRRGMDRRPSVENRASPAKVAALKDMFAKRKLPAPDDPVDLQQPIDFSEPTKEQVA